MKKGQRNGLASIFEEWESKCVNDTILRNNDMAPLKAKE